MFLEEEGVENIGLIKLSNTFRWKPPDCKARSISNRSLAAIYSSKDLFRALDDHEPSAKLRFPNRTPVSPASVFHCCYPSRRDRSFCCVIEQTQECRHKDMLVCRLPAPWLDRAQSYENKRRLSTGVGAWMTTTLTLAILTFKAQTSVQSFDLEHLARASS